MKNKILKYLTSKTVLVISIISILSACKKNLDVVPTDRIGDNILWTSKDNANSFLNNIYGELQGQYTNTDPLENCTDNALSGVAGSGSSNVIGAGISAPANGLSMWHHYSNIRKTNLFIEKVTSSQLPEDWKKLRLAEARFLRAYFHSLLWCYHGGVPIITKVLNYTTQGEEIFQKRNTFDETFKFIKAELDAAAAGLPLKAESGRASKGAALTLKGWCELFAASPLNNPSNDLQMWAQAAKTNKEVMMLGVYNLFPDHRTLFLEENNNNSEVILSKPYYKNNGQTFLQGPTYINNQQRAYGYSNPTQELVDEYVMANGLPISDPQSGYDPNNPYMGREKRFYDDIIYDGAEWGGYATVIRKGMGSRNETDLGDINEATNTGYYWKKMLDPRYAGIGNMQNSAHFILFRYAEILLSYAEAQNEAVGPDQSVYDAVNTLRARVNLPNLSAGLSQTEMRKVILRERRVELAYEEKRWFDLIRLKMANEKLNTSLKAVVIEQSNGIWKYNYVPARGGIRVFYPNKNYLNPIPQSAIDRNKQLVQNPGY